MPDVNAESLLSGAGDDLGAIADSLEGTELDDLSGDDLGRVASAMVRAGYPQRAIPLTPDSGSYSLAKGGTSVNYKAAPTYAFVVNRIHVTGETAAVNTILDVTDVTIDRRSQLEVSGRIGATAFQHDSTIHLSLDKSPEKGDIIVQLQNNSAATDTVNNRVTVFGYSMRQIAAALGRARRR